MFKSTFSLFQFGFMKYQCLSDNLMERRLQSCPPTSKTAGGRRGRACKRPSHEQSLIWQL